MTRRLSKYERGYLKRKGKLPRSSSPPAATLGDGASPSELPPQAEGQHEGVEPAGAELTEQHVEASPVEMPRSAAQVPAPSPAEEGAPPATSPAATATGPAPVEDPSVHVGHTAETCPYLPPREYLLTATFTSSNIAGAELDTTTGILSVSFTNGKTYRYRHFTAELFAAWKEAKSAGNWFHHNVRQRAAAHPPIDAPTAPAAG